MIIFDYLKISDDGKQMLINLHVNSASYFENITVESITIMTADKVSEAHTELPTDDFIYYQEFDNTTKEIALVLNKGDFDEAFINWNPTNNTVIDDSKPYGKISYKKSDLNNTLFFVYVKCREGVIVGCPPCGSDELTTVGVVFNEKLLYQRIMGFTRQLADDCQVPVGFSDFILLWNAFKAAVETGHLIAAIKYFNMLFADNRNTTFIKEPKPCGCHG